MTNEQAMPEWGMVLLSIVQHEGKFRFFTSLPCPLYSKKPPAFGAFGAAFFQYRAFWGTAD